MKSLSQKNTPNMADSRFSRSNIWVIVFSSLAVLGCLFPWVTQGCISVVGYRGDGILVLCGSLLVVLLCIGFGQKKKILKSVLVLMASAFSEIVAITNFVYLLIKFSFSAGTAVIGTVVASTEIAVGTPKIISAAVSFPADLFFFKMRLGDEPEKVVEEVGRMGYSVYNIMEKTDKLFDSATVGWGLYLSMLAGLLALIGCVYQLHKHPRGSSNSNFLDS